MKRSAKRRAFSFGIVGLAIAILVLIWSTIRDKDSLVLIYFGKPSDMIQYVAVSWERLLHAGISCFITAAITLLLSGILAVILLTVGLFSEGGLALIERFAAVSQTLPLLIIVTVSLLLERKLFQVLGVDASPDIYCVLPVTLSLVFTPLVSGVGAITRMPIQLKAILRLWEAPPVWRIWHVYLPYAMAEVLTGVRASATWAVGAVLITEGLVNGVSGDTLTLGNALMRPFSASRPGQTPVVILTSTILGFLIYYLFSFFQNYMEQLLYGRTASVRQSYPLQNKKPTSRTLIGGHSAKVA